MQRRLSAILAADMVGYSRLMAADERATIARQKELHTKIIEPAIDRCGGRIVKTMGDGILVEFSSAVDAVQSALQIQRAMAEHDPEVDEENRILYRIGINLGDISLDGDDVLGDGVNVAARLEGLAVPGGICISDVVYQTLQGKLAEPFTDSGEQALKNMSRKVRVWQWVPERTATQIKSSVALHEKPSIAVLPFTNMSGDPEQEYFSDGITEDVITELARFKNLFVIARNSTFVFKGRAVNIREAGEKLGATYLVEGSVRKAGGRVRVTAQLVEAASGNHLWAERYDRDLRDIFEVQDEIVREIATMVPGQLGVAAWERARRRPVDNMTAYDYLLRGEWLLNARFGSDEARGFFQKAIELDPQCARAYTHLAAYHAYSVFAHGAEVEEAVERCRSYAESALDIDPGDPAVQATAAIAYLLVGEHELARLHIDKAKALNPNDITIMNYSGNVLGYLGEHGEGLRWKQRAADHDPLSGDSHREGFFDLLYASGRYEEALKVFAGWRNPPPHMYLEVSAAYAQLGQLNQASAAIEALERLKPKGFDATAVVRAHARMCARPEDREHWLEGYRKAGVPL